MPTQDIPAPELLYIIAGDREYAIYKILAVKLICGQLKYCANWIKRDEDLTYYPVRNFMYSPHLFRLFHKNNLNLPSPPSLLPPWIQA